MILTQPCDPRFITLRRGGTLSDADHYLLAIWATACAEHVLPFFEEACPGDDRPRQAIAQTCAWVRGENTMRQGRQAAYDANAAARELKGAARYAAYAAGQAAVVAHVAAHELGAAAYAIRAVQAAASKSEREQAGRQECQWQREQLPDGNPSAGARRPAATQSCLLVRVRRCGYRVAIRLKAISIWPESASCRSIVKLGSV